MSREEHERLEERVRKLRDGFDLAFAAPIAAERGARIDFLAIRVGGDPYALRLSELLGLAADKKIVPTPSGERALLGLAGFRGSVTPVFDLARLLGYPPANAPRWIVLAGERAQVGLSFETFESHLRVESSALLEKSADERPGLRGAMRDADITRPILHSKTLLSMIEERAPEPGASEER